MGQRAGLLVFMTMLLGWSEVGLSQNCVPDTIILTTQNEVDNFQTSHGPCHQVVTLLAIGPGVDINNLDGLAGLTIINGLLISNVPVTDITGLSSVTSINGINIDSSGLSNLNGLSGFSQLGALNLSNNPVLTNLSALSGLTDLGNLILSNNSSLVNLDALIGLTTMTGDIRIINNALLTDISGLANAEGFQYLEIMQNPQLASLDGLQGQTDLIGLVIEDNDTLLDLAPLAGLTSVGNLNPQMRINDNDMLLSLDGLGALESLDADLFLNNNPLLGTCGALATLLDDVDDGTSGPGPGAAGIPDINGDVTIAFNAAGCNSVAEIVGGGGPVDCTPANITLSDQSEVDGFQTNHGPCDRIAGFLTIGGGDIVNLDGLAGITEVAGGNLIIADNNFLANTSGLSDLTGVSAHLQVFNNLVLANLDGLSSLTNVGAGIVVADNPVLQNFNGLSSVTSTDLDVQIERNLQLNSLNGLQGITELGAFVLDDNDSLPNVDGLSNLTDVGNLRAEMAITGNAVLANLDSLSNLVGVDAGVGIRNNPMLNECSVLATLMDDVDDASPGPGPGASGIPDIDGLVDLQNNVTGCNSIAEILGGGPDTEPPVVTAPADVVGVEATAMLTPVDLGMASVTDNSGEMLTATPDNPGPFPLGDTTVTWSATDSSGNTGMDQQLVNIVDTTPPMIIAPDDITTAATGVGTMVSLGSAIVTDNAGAGFSVANDAPDVFPVGISNVTWTATDASGNMDDDTQVVTITPPEILVPGDRTPSINGRVGSGEWNGAATLNMENGTISFMHDRFRLYVLINMFGDDGDDPFMSGGGDQFWLHFDVDEDGAITPDVDLRFRLESGTGNLRFETYCDGCPFGFNPLESRTLSARGESFSCSFADGSATFFPLTCDAHRVWELALDFTELDLDVDLTTKIGFLVSSGTPMFTENLPVNLNDMANYGALTLLGDVSGPDVGPGPMNPEFEVTQAIQTPDNDLDLVAGKLTAVRIWDANNSEFVKTYTYGSRNGIDLTGSPLFDFSTLRSSVNDNWVRDSVSSSSFLILPDSWSAEGLVDFEIEVWGQDGSQAASLADSVDFVPTRTPVFWTVPIRNIDTTNNNFSLANANLITNAEQWLRIMAPIENIDIVRRPILDVTDVTTSAGLKSILNNYDMLTVFAWFLGLAQTGSAPFDLPEQTTGFTATSLRANGRQISGSSDRVGKGGNGRITWAQQSTNNTSTTYPHELNHNLDRAATSTWGLHSRGCNAQSGGDLDPNWPYGTSFEIQEAGISPDGMGFQSVSDDTPDLMSYCFDSGFPRQWWSPYRWQAWVDEFRTDTTGQERGPEPTPEDSFYIQGRVFPDDSGEFVDIIRQPGLPDAVDVGGDYKIQILDCGDLVLAENSFDVSFLGDEGESDEFVSFVLVLPDAVDSCSITLSLNDVILESRVISANPPSVTLLVPDGGENWTGNETISWTGDDPDGDPLQYSLLMSADDGMTWLPIAGMIDATSYAVDSTQWPGTDEAKIRVIASDGTNTGHDDSDAAFSIASKSPSVQILAPEDGSYVGTVFDTRLTGFARDDSGHIIAPESLLWSLDGEIVGIGATTPVTLDEGAHEIVLDVIQGETVVATTSITVNASNTPGIFGFDAPEYTVDEASGEVTLSISRTGGVGGNAGLLIETMDGTAISGGDPAAGEDDFVPIPGEPPTAIEWLDGDGSSKTVTITINPDEVSEGEETFQVILTAVDDEQISTAIATVHFNSETAVMIFSSGFE